MRTLSITKTYQDRHILLAGASGFLGKVWLSLVLFHLPQIGRIYVLLRKKGSVTAKDRFVQILESFPVFNPLREKYGASLLDFVLSRVEVLDGDMAKPNLGLSEESVVRLQENVDLFVNSSGLVDFNPDLSDALATNVDGTLEAAQFVSSCKRAALLHISTCYVAGQRQGRISESIEADVSPNGKPLCMEQEYLEAKSLIQSMRQLDPKIEATIEQRLRKRHNGNGSQKVSSLLRRRLVRQKLIEKGSERALHFGWPNTYTYTKAMAEVLLVKRFPTLRCCVFRPSIVESALAYPFPGWNEGFNTCGPLTHLLGTWFRYLPAKTGNPFDIIPVDLVAHGLLIAGAQLMVDEAKKVYHCGTSDLNQLTIDRACELTSLSHRMEYRTNGHTFLEKVVRSRWKAVPVSCDHPMAPNNVRSVVQNLHHWLCQLPKPLHPLTAKLTAFAQRSSRKWGQIHALLELFRPFIYDNTQVFETKSLVDMKIEEEQFRFVPQNIDWTKYWLDIQMPGLRRWCFPTTKKEEMPTFAGRKSAVVPSSQVKVH